MAAPCAHVCVRWPVRKIGRVRPFNGIVRCHLARLDDWNKACDLVEATLASLAKRGYEDLLGLPEDYVPDFEFHRTPDLAKIDLCLYKHIQPDGRIRIIAQVFKRRFLINLIWAIGILVSRDGSTTPVPEEQLWEYM